MPDPTTVHTLPLQILNGCFLAAVGVFGVAAAIRFRNGGEAAVVETLPPPLSPPPLPLEKALPAVSPYEPPLAPGVSAAELAAVVAAVPVDKVEATPGISTRVYRPLDLAWLAFLVFFFWLSGSSQVSRVAVDLAKKLDAGSLITSIVAQFVFAGATVAVVMFRVRISEWLGLRWRKWGWAFLIGPGVVILMWTLMAILGASGYMKWMESFGGEATQDTVKLLKTSTDPVILALMAFAAVIVAPLCEEVVFRGYLYPAAKRFAGVWPAAIFSAIIFAAAHGNIPAMLPLFLLALALIFVYEKTGSIWAPMAIHCCFNGGTVGLQLLARYLNISVDPGM